PERAVGKNTGGVDEGVIWGKPFFEGQRMVSPRPLSKKTNQEKCKIFSKTSKHIFNAFLGRGLGEPLFGLQRAVPPEIPE
ncbi:MAG: hypothetical protein IJJ60_10155, partial [Clostridia bacterium]|nr:hypothetical protein [Clostridia bacterium]